MSTLDSDNKLDITTEASQFDLFIEKMIHAAQMIVSPAHASDDLLGSIDFDNNPLLSYEEKVLGDIKEAIQEAEGEQSEDVDHEGFGHVLHRIKMQLNGDIPTSAITISEQNALIAKIKSLSKETNIHSQRIDLSPMNLDDTAHVVKESGAIKVSANIHTPAAAAMAPAIPAAIPMAPVQMPGQPAANQGGLLQQVADALNPASYIPGLSGNKPSSPEVKPEAKVEQPALDASMDADVADLLNQAELPPAPQSTASKIADALNPASYIPGLSGNKPSSPEVKPEAKVEQPALDASIDADVADLLNQAELPPAPQSTASKIADALNPASYIPGLTDNKPVSPELKPEAKPEVKVEQPADKPAANGVDQDVADLLAEVELPPAPQSTASKIADALNPASYIPGLTDNKPVSPEVKPEAQPEAKPEVKVEQPADKTVADDVADLLAEVELPPAPQSTASKIADALNPASYIPGLADNKPVSPEVKPEAKPEAQPEVKQVAEADAPVLVQAEKQPVSPSTLTKVADGLNAPAHLLNTLLGGLFNGLKPAAAKTTESTPPIIEVKVGASPSPLTASVLNIAQGKPSTLKIESPIKAAVLDTDEVAQLLDDVVIPNTEAAKNTELDADVMSLLDDVIIPNTEAAKNTELDADVMSLLDDAVIPNTVTAQNGDIDTDVMSLLEDVVLPRFEKQEADLDDVASLLADVTLPPVKNVIVAKDVVSGIADDNDVEELLASTTLPEPGMTFKAALVPADMKAALGKLRIATENYERESAIKTLAEQKLHLAQIQLLDAQKTATEAGNTAELYRKEASMGMMDMDRDTWVTTRINDFRPDRPDLKQQWVEGKKAAIHQYAEAEIVKLGKEVFTDGKVHTVAEIKALFGSQIAQTDGLLKLSQAQFAPLEAAYEQSKAGKWFSSVRSGVAPEGYQSAKDAVTTHTEKLAALQLKQLEVAEIEKKVAAWDNLLDALNNETAAKQHFVTCQQDHNTAIGKVAAAEIPMKAAQEMVAHLQAEHHHTDADAGGHHDATAHVPMKAVVDEHSMGQQVHSEF